MAALKWLVVTVCGVLALGLAGLGVKSGMRLRDHDAMPVSVAKVSMRPFPSVFVAGARVVPAKTAVEPPAPMAAPEVIDAGALMKPAPGVPAKADAGAAGVVAARPDAGAPAVAVAAKPAVVDAGVKPVVAAPVPAPVAPVPAPAPVAAAASDAVLNLRASDTADVFVDGKRVGSSPVLGVKVKVGAHKIRFDCYDAAGNTVAGAVQTVSATAEKDVDVVFTCPASE